MDLHLNTTGDPGGELQGSSSRKVNSGENPGPVATGQPHQSDGSATFARLLARRLDMPGTDAPPADDASVSERPARSETTGGTRDYQANESDGLGTRDPAHPDTSERHRETTENGESLASALRDAGWTSLAGSWGGLSSPVDLVAMLPTGPLDLPGMEAVPAEVRAKLAGDIAAGFTDRHGVQTLNLKLEPGHLGRVEVRLQARGDHLSVRIAAGSKEAAAVLRENLRDLTDALQDKTGRYQTVDVRVQLKAEGESNRWGHEDPHQPSRDRQPGEDPTDGRQEQENRGREFQSDSAHGEAEPAPQAQGG